MKQNTVLDASALAALLFGEPEAGAIAAQMSGAALVAPVLLDYELASVCAKKIRGDPSRRELFLRGFALRATFDIELVAVDHGEVVHLALQQALSTYDASYLWLSRQRQAPLLTLDKKLAARASR